ncbi:MAG: flagellar basal body L-ring protein FlgH [Paracoccaceae bacterium]|nr:flagellar basal body L-ring protein FlgH [Paracoccaceae bacterium]
MRLCVLLVLGLLAACSRLEDVGKAPEFTPINNSQEYQAMARPNYGAEAEVRLGADRASLWSAQRGSLLGDNRAERAGDILTVVIEIDDSAEIQNSSERSRSGSQSASIPSLFGIEQLANTILPGDNALAAGISTNSSSDSSGDGSVRRNERLELRVAATVTEMLPNGILRIQGSQEVRVNFEIRELLVTGYVRPEDISRRNEITYDKIASARISYGGRGQITDVQQPPAGQQIADILVPF